MSGRHCPFCEEEYDDFELWDRPEQKDIPMASKSNSMLESSVTMNPVRMITLDCGHAFRLQDFSDFEDKMTEYLKLSRFVEQAKAERMIALPPVAEEALRSEMFDLDAKVGRLGDECNEHVVEDPEVTP